MTYTELERRYREDDGAFPRMLFRRETKWSPVPTFGNYESREVLLQLWEYHDGNRGLVEEWIEVPEVMP